jgi:hypothetical protein
MMWIYSTVHFLLVGVVSALQNYVGDFLATFPSSTIVTWIGRPDLFTGGLAEIFRPPPTWGYGPILHAVTFPLLFLPTLRMAYQVWLFANYVFLAAASVLLYRVAFAKPARLVNVTLFAFMMLNYYPLYEGLIQRTIEIFELLLIAGAMTYCARHRDGPAGMLVGFAAMAKFLPGIFIPYFALKRRWRALLTSTIVVAVVAFLTQISLGWQNNNTIIRAGQRPFFVDRSLLELDQSVPGSLLRILTLLSEPFALTYGSLLSLAVILTLGAAFVWTMLRFSSGNWKIHWSLLAVAMIMLVPHNENYYLMFLLVPYSVLLGMALESHMGKLRNKALLMASFVLTGWPFPLSFVDQAFGIHSAQILLWTSVPVIGTGLLVLVLLDVLTETAPAKRPRAGRLRSYFSNACSS